MFWNANDSIKEIDARKKRTFFKYENVGLLGRDVLSLDYFLSDVSNKRNVLIFFHYSFFKDKGEQDVENLWPIDTT